MKKRIPIHGSMTRPGNPDEGLHEMIEGRLSWKGKNPIVIDVSTEEFTSVCPTTGQPDFGEIAISYVPENHYLESKTVKYYLMAYREHGAHCETLADKICSDMVAVLSPFSCTVKVTQKPRGGLTIISTSTFNR